MKKTFFSMAIAALTLLSINAMAATNSVSVCSLSAYRDSAPNSAILNVAMRFDFSANPLQIRTSGGFCNLNSSAMKAKGYSCSVSKISTAGTLYKIECKDAQYRVAYEGSVFLDGNSGEFRCWTPGDQAESAFKLEGCQTQEIP